MVRTLFSWCLPLILGTAIAFGQSSAEPKDLKEIQSQATRLDKMANRNQGRDVVFESFSKQLNVPVATLREQQKSTNLGFGQLFIANSLAASSGKTFDQISQEFKSGKVMFLKFCKKG
jgi:hypothetical protein